MVRALLVLACLGALATPAGAQSVEVFGYAGVLGEWELNAEVTQTHPGDSGTFLGPLTMRHVGICTQAGPEEKSGEIRLLVSLSRLNATLTLTNEQCSFTGRLSGSYTGVLTCRDRGDVPLKLWLKGLPAVSR
jgi:hypothetical protein